MTDATEADTHLPTDLGDGRRAGRDTSSGLPRIDLTSRDQVFELARELIAADKRRLQQVTFAEWQAVALLAVIGAPVLAHAEVVAALAKPGDDLSEATGAIFELVKLTRALNDAQKGETHGQG